MSFSLALADGDLVQKGNQLDIVAGTDKLNQDIFLWLMERYGGDRFHVNLGSILQEFIGDVVGDDTRSQVQAEVLRVLQNYQTTQIRALKENPQRFSTSELLVAVDDIKTTITYDTVNVTIKLRNGSGNSATIRVASSVQQ